MFYLKKSFFLLAVLFVLGLGLSCSSSPAKQIQELMNPAQLGAWFQKATSDFAESNKAIGLSAIFVTSDGFLYHGQFGTVDDERLPFTTKTSVPIGSLTKSFTGLWFLRKQKEHGLHLNDKLPGARVKASELLSHSSGLQSDVLNGMFVYGCPKTRFSNEELQKYFQILSPGEWRYSNLGYESLASRVAEILNVNFESSVMEEMAKIGLDDIKWANCKDGVIPGFSEGKKLPPIYLRDLAAGGLEASAEELTRYVQTVMSNKLPTGEPLIEPQVWSEFFKNQIPKSIESFGLKYGIGWNLNGIGRIENEEIIWHLGHSFPYQSAIAMIPSRKMALVILSNTQESAGHIFPFIRQTFEAMTGKTVEIDKPQAVPTNLENWAGDYASFNDQLISISKVGTSLRAELFGQTFSLEPEQDRLIPYVIKLWGLIKIKIPEVYVDAIKTENSLSLILKGWGAPLTMTKLKQPEEIPLAWKMALGKYSLDRGNLSSGPFVPTDLVLKEKQGRLVAEVNLRVAAKGSAAISETPLHVVSDTVAITAKQGIRLELTGTGLEYSGYRFFLLSNSGK